MTLLAQERQELEQELAVARSSGNHTAIGHAGQDLGLVVWEQVGVLGEFCEQLASIFEAVRGHEPGSGDLGAALLAFTRPAWRTIGNEVFADVAWWTSRLGIEEPVPEKMQRLLSPSALAMAEAMFRDARKELAVSLTNVRCTYTRPIHRVAQRRKHAHPLLSGYGFEWVTAVPHGEAALASEVLAHSPFTVVDEFNGERVGLSVPGDRWATEQLLGGIASADWLLHALSTAVVTSAENRTGVPLLFMPVGENWTMDTMRELLGAYTGYSDATFDGLAVEKASRESHVAAARARLSDAVGGGTFTRRLGRSERCWCGSGAKYKKCHGR